MKYIVAAAALAGAVSALPADEWNTWSTTTTTSSAGWEAYTTTTTTKAEWTPVPVKEKCSYLTTYTTKECGDDDSKWDNCKVATKTSTVYTDAEKCTWAPWPTTTPAAEWSTYPVKEKCTYTSTYVTTEYDEKKEWETAKVVTKTTVYVTEADKCSTTWGSWSAIETPKASSTWVEWSTIPASTKTPVAASSAWNTWAASSTVAAPVAKWTGAADKNTFAMGALAVAGLAALL